MRVREMALLTAVSSGKVDLVQSSLPSDEINARDPSGATPLFVAASKGSHDICKLLLFHGAKVNSRNRKNWTPLHAACAASSAISELIETLITAGAKLNQKNCRGRTPFMVACHDKHVDIALLLLEKGANVRDECMFGRRAIHWAVKTKNLELVKAVIKAGGNLEAEDNWSKRPLFEAVRCGAVSVVQYLCSLNVDLNSGDRYGRLPLHYAAIKGFTECAEVLLSYGVEVDVFMHNGTTPLMWAAAHAQIPMLNLLLDHGADPQLTDRSKSNAVHRLLIEMKRSADHKPWLQAMVRLIQADVPLNSLLTRRFFHVQSVQSLSLLDIVIKANLPKAAQLLCLSGASVYNPKITDELNGNSDALDVVTQFFSSPLSLKLLCRRHLRPLSRDVSALPVALQKYLKFEDLLQFALEHDGSCPSDEEDIPSSEGDYEPSDYDSDLYGQRTPVDSD